MSEAPLVILAGHVRPRVFTATMTVLTGGLACSFASGAGARGTFHVGPVLIIVTCIMSFAATLFPSRRLIDTTACAAFAAAFGTQAISLAWTVQQHHYPWFGKGGAAVGVVLWTMFSVTAVFAWMPVIYFGAVTRRAKAVRGSP